jgi:hypothetical protein
MSWPLSSDVRDALDASIAGLDVLCNGVRESDHLGQAWLTNSSQ